MPRLRGFPRFAGTEGDQCGLDRHGKPLAWPGFDLCRARGERYLLREADQPDPARRPILGGGYPPVGDDLPGRHTAPVHRLLPFRQGHGEQGSDRRLHTVEMQVWKGPAIPHEAAASVPTGWDYDLWLGQSPWHPFVSARVNSWQYFWDTAEGILTDMGCHYTDQMQWVLGKDATGPVEFEASGDFPDPVQFSSDTPVTGITRR